MSMILVKIRNFVLLSQVGLYFLSAISFSAFAMIEVVKEEQDSIPFFSPEIVNELYRWCEPEVRICFENLNKYYNNLFSKNHGSRVQQAVMHAMFLDAEYYMNTLAKQKKLVKSKKYKQATKRMKFSDLERLDKLFYRISSCSREAFFKAVCVHLRLQEHSEKRIVEEQEGWKVFDISFTTKRQKKKRNLHYIFCTHVSKEDHKQYIQNIIEYAIQHDIQYIHFRSDYIFQDFYDILFAILNEISYNGIIVVNDDLVPVVTSAIKEKNMMQKNKINNILAQNPAYVFFPNGKGSFPLHIACEIGNYEFVEVLLHHGALPNLRSNEGSTCLLDLVVSGNTCELIMKIAALFFSYKADPNIQDDDGFAPLHQAYLKSNDENFVNMLALFKKNGADFTLKDKQGHEPLFYLSQLPIYFKVLEQLFCEKPL